MDKGEVTALTLLDLSAAFDTIDHATLTDRLSDWYGISGQAQIWFSSYLQNGLQSVKIEDTFSDKVTLLYGVPQGSVLGPVFFTSYTTPLSAIISSFDINHHLYADDTQIYMSLSVSNAKEFLEKLQHCLMDVSAWMTGSKLKLNPSKTEFLLIGKLQRKFFLNNLPCLLLGQERNPSTSAKNLGVLFDSSLNFRKHISQTCRACFYHIRDLRHIRKNLSLDLAKQIAVALASSKLDYCNSLFHNMPEKEIARLQRVQNCLARVVTNAPRFSRSIPILKLLHWLPVKFRIHFKICAITFRTLRENQPAYLADLLVRPKCSKYLRSTNSNRFVVPRIKTKTGSRAFSISGPALWNALPVPIRNAKTKHSGNYLNLTYLTWLFHPSPSAARLPADEPALASIMTHDHAKDLCTSELGPLRI